MKTIIKVLGLGILAGVGSSAGYWLWEEVLEDKVDDLKDRLSKKNSEKSWP